MKTINSLMLLSALFVSNVCGAVGTNAKIGNPIKPSASIKKIKSARPTGFAAIAATPVTAVERFEYTSLGNLNGSNGGTGWAGPWEITSGAVSIEAGNLTTNPGTPAGKIRFTASDPYAYRNLASTYKDSVGKVYWINFSMRGTRAQQPDSVGVNWAGISLFNNAAENIYIGKSDDFGVGFGDDVTIAKSLLNVNHYLVKIVMTGDNAKETAYMWRNYYGTTMPANATANLTAQIGEDSRLNSFNRIRLAGAGDNGTTPNVVFDDIRISETFQASVGTTVPVTAVSLNRSVDTVIIGATKMFTATILPLTSSSTALTWTSSNPAVATVSSTGQATHTANFTGVSAGTATITVTTVDGSRTATCLVRVPAANPVVSVSLAPTTATIPAFGTQQLTPTILPANATITTVTWASSNPAVAIVSSTGLVTGISIGTATITVTTTNGSKTATAAITVTAPVAITTVVERFEYPAGNLNARNGGTGWAGAWDAPNGVNVEAGNLASTLGTPSATARFVQSDPRAFRNLTSTFPDAPGKVYWINFSMQGFKIAPDPSGTNGFPDSLGVDWSGISLYNGEAENGFVGKSDNFGVGFGDASTIPGVLFRANHYLVKIVMSGDNAKETAYMWRNYFGTTEPAIATANLTTTSFGADERLGSFNRIRLAGAGQYGRVPNVFIDDIRISETFQAFTTFSTQVVSIALTPNSITMPMNNPVLTRQLIPVFSPANATNTAVIWTSSDPGVVSVSNTGVLTPLSIDTCTITATTVDRARTARVKVTVVVGTSVRNPAGQKANLMIYPNPVADGSLNVALKNDAIKSISVLSITGSRMINMDVKSGSSAAVVNVKSLAKGIYILEVTTDKSIIRKQVVIN